MTTLMNKKNPRFAPRVAYPMRTGLVYSALLALAMPATVRAAGGHHAVDDAAILDPGQCQIETWVDRERGGGRSLLHIGPACRIGAIELGLNLDRTRLSGAGTATAMGPQVKWAGAVADGWTVGVVASASWAQRGSGYLGSAVVVPVTWQASDTVLLHLNAGRDFRAHAADETRAGAAIEWAPLPAWSFVAERFRESRRNYWRAGARWAFAPTWSIDVSRASTLDGSAPAWWTLGLTWAFDR